MNCYLCSEPQDRLQKIIGGEVFNKFTPFRGSQVCVNCASINYDKSDKIVCVSGGFDPVHFGHIRMINDAAQYGKVIVILNSDEWLREKKGYAFQSWEQRAEIIHAIRGVLCVVSVDDRDGTVCEALKRIRPDFFCNGGDRAPENTPELTMCCDLGIRTVFNVGGEKIESSSSLVNHVSEKKMGLVSGSAEGSVLQG